MGRTKIARSALSNLKKNANEKWKEKYEKEKTGHDESNNKLLEMKKKLDSMTNELEVETKLRISFQESLAVSQNNLKQLREKFHLTIMHKNDMPTTLNNSTSESTSLKTENDLLLAELDNLKRMQLLNSLKFKESSEEARMNIKRLEKDVKLLRKELWMEKEINQEKVAPMPFYSAHHSSYKQTKAVKCIMEFIKKGVKNGTDFAHLIRNLVRTTPFPDADPFQLSAEETFILRSTIHLSDGDLKKMKKFLKDRLGFDILASRQSIAEVKKSVDKSDNYGIEIVKKDKVLQNGKMDSRDTIHIVIKDMQKGVTDRVKMLDDHNLLIDSEDSITLCLLGDKGSEETKICISVENVSHPNSPHNLLLVGLYEGQDNESELRNNVLDVFMQWNKLKELNYIRNDGTSTTRTIKKKVIGDLKLLSAYLGHRGQAATNPCHLCEVSWSTHGIKMLTLSAVNFNAPFRMRTLNSYNRDSKTGDNSVIKGSTPLCEDEPSDFVILTLHLTMGCFEKYFLNHINGQLNCMDGMDSMSAVTLKDQKKELSALLKEENFMTTQVKLLETSTEESYSVAAAYEKIRQNPKLHIKSPETLCDAEVCIINHMPNTESDDWIRCHKCQLLYHLPCASMFAPEDKITIKRQKQWKCFKCINISGCDLLTNVMNQNSILTQMLEDSINKLKGINEKRMKLEDILCRSTGENRKKMELLLAKIGCDGRTWYQSPNGNRVRKLLRSENITLMFQLLPDTELNQNVKRAMVGLSEIMSFSNNMCYSDQEIEEVDKILQNFLINMKRAFPDESLTPKLHLLGCHLIPFMKNHRSWGRSCEQGIEHYHAQYNTLKRLYHPVKNLKNRAQLIVQELITRNWLCDSGVWIA